MPMRKATQRTETGYEIPVPTRREVEGALEAAAKAQAPSRRRKRRAKKK
jgi:hypothetical protein